MMAHDDLLDLVGAYALGAVNKREAAQVREHLKTCAACRAEYAELRPSVSALAYTAQTPASDLLKARIMKTVRAEAVAGTTARRPRTFAWPAYGVAAAAMLIALWTTVSNIMVQSDLRQSRDQVAVLSTQLAAQNKLVTNEKMMVADLMSSASQRYAVAGGEIVRHGPRLYMAMHGMPMPPKGHVYQAWYQKPGSKEMTPSVTFMPDRTGVAVLAIPANAETMAAVALSVEPEGGSKAPTTKPEFVVKLT